MAINQISTHELFVKLTENSVKPEMPIEVECFFEDNFDFNLWQWNCDKSKYWNLLDSLYPHRIDHQEGLIYYDNHEEIVQLLKGLAWVIEALKDELADEKRIVQALELSIIVPNFFELSHSLNLKFSEKAKVIVINFIKNIKLNIGLQTNAQRFERENIESILGSLKTNNWVALENHTHQLEQVYDFFIISNVSNQPFRFLVWHSRDEAISVISHETDPVKLLAWVSHIPVQLSSEFILNIKNELVRFLLLVKNKNITIENEFLLSNLWEELDKTLLTDWISIFNKYPVRFPHLQRGIGKFLSGATIEQITIYIDSLSLEESHSENVQKCIDELFKSASNQQKSCFLNLAFQKWLNWKPESFYKVYRSSLDKAIVIYFKDFCDKNNRNTFINNNVEEILQFSSLWFKNRIKFEKYIFERISKIQPACIANQMSDNPDKSFEDCTKLLFTPDYFDTDLRWKNWIKFD